MGLTRNYYTLLNALLFYKNMRSGQEGQQLNINPPLCVRNPSGNWGFAVGQGAYNSNAFPVSTTGIDFINAFSVIIPFKSQCCIVQSNDPAGFQNGMGMTGLMFGSGNTAENYDDYKLDSLITSGLALNSQTGTITPTQITADNHVKWETDFAISDSVGHTIREYGIVVGGYNGSPGPILIYRKVLDEPVVTEPGGSLKLKIKSDNLFFNYVPFT